jgi:two-component system NtrC family sensor kinase
VTGSDEVADLAQTFNRMAAQIRERIAESESLRAYVERVLDQMEASILVISGDHRLEYANRVALDRYGPLNGGCCEDSMKDHRPCEACPVSEVLETGTVVVRTFEAPSGRTYELKWVPILGRNRKPAVVERALDVTERVAFQERFQRAHRLAVAGEVAAGVVHSVNNPLDGVRRALDLAQAAPENADRVSRMLSLAKEGTDRIAHITRTLLGFARGDEARNRVPVQVDALIEAAVNLSHLRAESKGLEIVVDTDPDLPAVWLDPQAMEQVLVNLLLNAVDACESGGVAHVQARARAGLLEISVTDTGPGIPAASVRRVFEPFFTTKDASRGTGLGLPVARRIVEAHGGQLILDPGMERGTRFVIQIPMQPEPIKQGGARA